MCGICTFLGAIAFALQVEQPQSMNAHFSSTAASLDADWRRPDRDGSNAIYFLARYHHKVATYEAIVAKLGDDRRVSLEEVREAANAFGLKLTAAKITPQRLMELNEPVISFYEDGGTRNASFIVVLSANRLELADGGVLILDAGPATIRHVAADEFRRDFSGYILLQDTRDGNFLGESEWTILAALIGFAAIITLRIRVIHAGKMAAQHDTAQH